MNLILSLNQIGDQDRPNVGGKAFALAEMVKRGMRVPKAISISTEAYYHYVSSTGLRDRIIFALYRKPFEEMRWEEIWDTALRIRNAFLQTAIPPDLQKELSSSIEKTFQGRSVSVRSSAPGEDSTKTSFAGLHESFLNLMGMDAILNHIRLVWASLWSDRAILYRKELGLDVSKSAMAVIVQEMVSGDRSGVVFGKNPMDAHQSVIEAVYGLNQGLVDGTVQPDRWILDRKTGRVISHKSVLRGKRMVSSHDGIRLRPLNDELREKQPLTDKEVLEVFKLAMGAESLFGPPQDVEWTYRNYILHTLQARPITTSSPSGDDQRPWYLTLHRSFENLKALRKKIEKDLLPAMEEVALEWSSLDLNELSDDDIAREIERRSDHYNEWLEIYRQNCIPFAHGVRLFGQIYNDVMQPDDPFEFTGLLAGSGMFSIQRNRILKDLASRIREDPRLAQCLKSKAQNNCDPKFLERLEDLRDQFGDLAWGDARFLQEPGDLFQLLLEMSSHKPEKDLQEQKDPGMLEQGFLCRFEGEQRHFAMELIDLARASYRLRDDDNIYLGKIEGQLIAAVDEGRRRLEKRLNADLGKTQAKEIVRALRDSAYIPRKETPREKELERKDFMMNARQIVGQPAGPGVAVGKARVILTPSDLFQFKRGEILVCDSVDPGMTFVVPLASGVVERRGGMLIHGAIIAREYGLPCVTGAPDAIRYIRTGDTVTVDGFLGIVVVGEPTLKGETSGSKADKKESSAYSG
jgi:pyruvate,water dikinase